MGGFRNNNLKWWLIISFNFTVFSDCYEAKEEGLPLPGTFTLQIDSETKIKAFCDADGFTYLMSRGQFQNPKDYFNKNWNGYKTAFGEPGKKRENLSY